MDELPEQVAAEVDVALREFADGAVKSAVERLTVLVAIANADGDTDLEWDLLYSIGQIHIRSGQFTEAQAPLNRALVLARQVRQREHELDALMELCWARVLGHDLNDAQSVVVELAAFVRLDQPTEGHRVDEFYGLLGLSHFNLGALGTGIGLMRRAVELAHTTSSDRLAIWKGNLGIGLLKAGEEEEARGCLQDAIRLEAQQGTGNLSLWERALDSANQKTRSSPAEYATQPSAHAFNHLSIRISVLSSIQEKLELLKAEQPRMDEAISVALHEWPALEAFALLDCAKSMVTRELMWRRLVNFYPISELAGEPQPAVLHGLRTQQVAEELARVPDTCVIHLYYTKRLDFFAVLGYCVDGVPHAQRLRIASGFSGHVIHQRLVQLVETRRKNPLVELTKELRELLCELGDTLVPIIGRIQGLKRVIFIPYKLLHSLPLHAMTSRWFRSSYLFTEMDVGYSPSLMANWTARLSRNGAVERDAMFVFVDVEGIEGPPPIEAQVLRGFFGGASEFTLATRAADIPSDLSGFRCLLWSSHAVSDPSDWTRSYLGAGRAGRYMASEILAEWRLKHTDLAILSGCETGYDKSVDDEVDEYLGIDAAVHVAGARSVISTLWPVEEHLAGLMSIFVVVGVLHDGQPPWRALRYAQLAMLSGSWRDIVTDLYARAQKSEFRAPAKAALDRVLDLPRDSFSDFMDFAAYRSFGV